MALEWETYYRLLKDDGDNDVEDIDNLKLSTMTLNYPEDGISDKFFKLEWETATYLDGIQQKIKDGPSHYKNWADMALETYVLPVAGITITAAEFQELIAVAAEKWFDQAFA